MHITQVNEAVVERLITCIIDRQVELIGELFFDDATMDWPQSRERVNGAANPRAIEAAFRQPPTITPRRTTSAGDFSLAKGTLNHGGLVYESIFIVELSDVRIRKEAASGSEPSPGALLSP